MRRRIPLLTLSLLVTASVCRAACPEKPTKALTLAELIDCAVSRYADVAEKKWHVAESQAQLHKARAAHILPHFRIEGESGVVPDAKGDVFHPPSDTTGLRSLGPFLRLKLEFAQPLWTFGQLGSLQRAAQQDVRVKQAELAGTRLDIALQVKKRYYAVLLAQDLRQLLSKVSSTIEDRLKGVDEEKTLSLGDLYKLRLARVTLESQQAEAERKLSLARQALAWQTGFSPGDTVRLAEHHLKPVRVQVPPLRALTEQAFATRPEWNQLQAGLEARKAQTDAARRAYLPQLYLGGGIRYAVAPGRTDQHNPFVVDSYNYLDMGAFIGFRQSLEWGLLGADVEKHQAQLRGLQAKESGARRAIRMDVERAYSAYQGALEKMQSSRESRRLGRQWLQEASDEYDFDPTTLQGLVEAFKTYATLEQEYRKSVYDYDLAIADLAHTAGLFDLSSKP